MATAQLQQVVAMVQMAQNQTQVLQCTNNCICNYFWIVIYCRITNNISTYYRIIHFYRISRYWGGESIQSRSTNLPSGLKIRSLMPCPWCLTLRNSLHPNLLSCWVWRREEFELPRERSPRFQSRAPGYASGYILTTNISCLTKTV